MSDREDPGSLVRPQGPVPRLDKAVRGQRCRVTAVDDRLDDIGRQKGEIDEMGHPALRHAFAVGDRLHCHAGLDLFEPDPALGEVLEKGVPPQNLDSLISIAVLPVRLLA